MSDFEVNLVNDSVHEFYVRFYGPEESELGWFGLEAITQCPL